MKFFGRGCLAVCLVLGFGAPVRAESFTTNIFSGIATNVAGDYIVGDTGSFNYLEINGGGALTCNKGILGNTAAASNNRALVTGSNSVWNASSFLLVGYRSSSNQLIVDAGARVAGGVGMLGPDPTNGYNTVQIVGTNSACLLSAAFDVASPGNQVTISNVAQATSTAITIGDAPDYHVGSNLLTVADHSLWSNSGTLIVGSYSPGNELHIEGGSQVLSNTSIALGRNASSSGNVLTVTGQNSMLQSGGTFSAGENGSGSHRITVSSGATFISNRTRIGYPIASGSNIITVTGTGTVWSNQFEFILQGARNVMTISEGARVLNSFVGIRGDSVSGNSLVQVTGTNSAWLMSGVFDVASPSNRIAISNAAYVASTGLMIGDAPDFFGGNLLIVTDHSVWSNRGSIVLGYQSPGNELRIEGGSQILGSTNVTLGYNYDNSSNNVLNITGKNSLLSNGGALTIGRFGSDSGYHHVTVSDGAALTSYVTIIGYGSAIGGNVISVSGTGSIWNGGSAVQIDCPNNLISITDGAYATNGTIFVGNQASSNLVLVSDPGTRMDSGPINIGYCANTGNELVVSNGAVVNAFYVWLECGAQMTLTGTNTICNSGSLYMWIDGSQVSILDGAQFFGNRFVYLNYGASNTVIVSGNNARWGGIGQIYLGGNYPNNKVIVGQGGFVDAAQMVIGSGSAGLSNLVTVAGTLTVTNGGSGQIQLQRGQILLQQGIITADSLAISAGAVVTGCGSIIGNINNSGTLAVNCPGGTLTISGVVTNNATIFATNNADIEFLGPVVNNGTINVINGWAHFQGGLINQGVYLDAGSVLRTTDMAPNGADMILGFATVSNKSYAVEFSDDFAAGAWLVLTNVTGSGTIIQIADPGAAALPRRFYRVHLNLP